MTNSISYNTRPRILGVMGEVCPSAWDGDAGFIGARLVAQVNRTP
jgi:hypothetical protein